mgnify:CR=1 FL=1
MSNKVFEFSISIPYGAIKRMLWNGNRPNLLSFQFLMVRLKDTYRQVIYIHLRISIPYGAIKRSTHLRF